MIVKRIYFPNDIYSKNRVNFESMLRNHGLLWGGAKVCTNKEEKRLLYGICGTTDNTHKVLYVFEGQNKPATLFYKTTGSGGNFLIDLNSFCTSLGCVIDTKSEDYMGDILLRLDKYGDINIPEESDARGKINDNVKKEKGEDSRKLGDFKLTVIDIKVRILTRRYLRRYLTNYGESLRRRGIGIKVALFFKKRDIERDVRWALQNNWL